MPSVNMSLVAASLTLGCLIGGACSAETAPPKQGAPAPAFSLGDLQGNKVSLADRTKQGPVVLVVLRGWPGYQCPLCTLQAGDFLAHADEFAKAGASVVMVYPGPAANLNEHAREFIAKKKLPANVEFVLDPDFTFVEAYGLRWNAPNETAYPATFVVDAGGKVLYSKVSDGHGGRTSAEEVLKAVPTK